MDSGTRAWQTAVESFHFQKNERILAARNEYGSNILHLTQVAERSGAELEFIETLPDGRISLNDLKRRLDSKVRLIAITHVLSSSGIVNPVNEIGAMARDAHASLLVDACQSVGQIPIDVGLIGCTMLCGTGRKWLRGPRGTAFLYVSSDFAREVDPPVLSLHAGHWDEDLKFTPNGDATGFETWEASYSSRAGLKAAAEYALGVGIDNIANRVAYLTEVLREALLKRPKVIVHEEGPALGGIVTFSVLGNTAGEVRRAMRREGIRIGICRAEHGRMGGGIKATRDILRASPHYFNTEEDIWQLGSLLP